MKYVICFGKYFLKESDESGFSDKVVGLTVVKDIQFAAWFNKAEEAKELVGKYGGRVKELKIDVRYPE